MYQLRLEVTPQSKKQPSIRPGVLTKRFHAFLLSSIQRQDPMLSNQLHKTKQRQRFSFYINGPQIQVHSPDKAVIQTLRNDWVVGTSIDLHTWRGTVGRVESQYLSMEDDQSEFYPSFKLRFLTPTTFYQQGNYYPLPELNRLILSANKIGSMIDPSSRLSLEQINRLAREIRIEYVQIHSQRVHFGSFSIIGFVGQLAFNMKGMSSMDQQIAWRLFRLGTRMGFGYKTAWGLGQADIETMDN